MHTCRTLNAARLPSFALPHAYLAGLALHPDCSAERARLATRCCWRGRRWYWCGQRISWRSRCRDFAGFGMLVGLAVGAGRHELAMWAQHAVAFAFVIAPSRKTAFCARSARAAKMPAARGSPEVAVGLAILRSGPTREQRNDRHARRSKHYRRSSAVGLRRAPGLRARAPAGWTTALAVSGPGTSSFFWAVRG